MVRWCKRDNPKLGVLGELQRKNVQKGLREREEKKKEYAEKLREGTRMTEKWNVRRERERWKTREYCLRGGFQVRGAFGL